VNALQTQILLPLFVIYGKQLIDSSDDGSVKPQPRPSCSGCIVPFRKQTSGQNCRRKISKLRSGAGPCRVARNEDSAAGKFLLSVSSSRHAVRRTCRAAKVRTISRSYSDSERAPAARLVHQRRPNPHFTSSDSLPEAAKVRSAIIKGST